VVGFVEFLLPRFYRRRSAVGKSGYLTLNLAHQVEAGGEGFLAGLPIGRANLAVVVGHVLSGLDLANEVLGGATDAEIVDLRDLDLTFRVDDEGAAQGEAFFFDHDIEAAGDAASRVADHREVDFSNGVGGVVPGLVSEVRVGGDREDFAVEFLELFIVVGEVAELCRADEGEVCRIEAEDAPFAFELLGGDGDELSLVESLCGEFRNGLVDHILSKLSDFVGLVFW